MYITLAGNIYGNIRYAYMPSEVVYIGDSLTGIISVSGTIGVYSNDGFLLREDNVADYKRQVIRDGEITLTNLPEPEPEPPEPDPDMWDELAAAIKDGVNHVE